MADHEKHDRKHDPGRSGVAVFASRGEAREAIAALHQAHFSHTWLGVTSLAEATGGHETLTVESQIGGFFAGTESLVDALVSRGVLGDTARDVERTIEPGDALVTVDPKDKDISEAVAIFEAHGGQVAGRLPMDGIARPARTTVSTQSGVFPDDDVQEQTFYRQGTLRR